MQPYQTFEAAALTAAKPMGRDSKKHKSLKAIIDNVSFTLALKAESDSEASDSLPTIADFSDIEDKDLPF